MKIHTKISAAAAELMKARYAIRSNPEQFKHLLPQNSFSNFNEG